MPLLDTNVVSEPLKRRPDSGVMARFRALPRADALISTITLLELRRGAVLAEDGSHLWQRIEVEVLLRVTVLNFDAAAACRAGDLDGELWQRGERLAVEDLLLAASALSRDLTLITRNLRHFERVPGLRLENWFG